mgnify:CR=1 FL=1
MPDTATLSLTDKLTAAREAARVLATATTGQKDAALNAIADAVLAHEPEILRANELDLANGRENGLSEGLQDRLRLDSTRLAGLARAVLQIAALPDPDRIAEVYLQLHRQHRSTWAFEVVLRPWSEKW